MSPSCPISTKRVDTNMVRIISFQVVIFSLVLIFTQNNFFALVLLFDFTMRVLRMTEWSPFHLLGKLILKGWGLEPKLCDESPKRFALYLGLIISLFLTLLYLGGTVQIATAVAMVLLACALLETLFDFCIGCKIYYVLQLIKVYKNDRNI